MDLKKIIFSLCGINFHDFFVQVSHGAVTALGLAAVMGFLDPQHAAQVVQSVNDTVNVITPVADELVKNIHRMGWAGISTGLTGLLLHNSGGSTLPASSAAQVPAKSLPFPPGV